MSYRVNREKLEYDAEKILLSLFPRTVKIVNTPLMKRNLNLALRHSGPSPLQASVPVAFATFTVTLIRLLTPRRTGNGRRTRWSQVHSQSDAVNQSGNSSLRSVRCLV